MQQQIIFLKTVKYLAVGLAASMLAGIATLMYIARDKEEDIAGIVASALFMAGAAAVVAIAAAVLEKRPAGNVGGDEDQ